MPNANPCALADTLANDYQNAVTSVNRKFNALRRLAELLEQIGDIAGAIPNLSSLVPLYLINLDSYTSLAQACPFLHLSNSPNNTDLAALQAQVASAYSRLIQRLNLSPFLRLGALQAQLDKVQSSVNEALVKGQQYVQCLQEACDESIFVNNNFQAELDQFNRGYVAANGQVLTQTMNDKFLSVRGAIDNVNQLLTTAPVVTPSPVPEVPQIPIPFNHPVPPPPIRPTP